jgi:NRAMP (natural resistance-associated macrophage protein)-like metal ion transporter
MTAPDTSDLTDQHEQQARVPDHPAGHAARPGGAPDAGGTSASAPTSLPTSTINPVVRLFKVLGPGLITGAADDDATGIGTYAQAGASRGYGLLWTALLTLPMMMTVQYLATKVAAVEGRGLSSVIRRHFPRPILYAAVGGLIVANVINAAADIGAIAAAINLMLPIPMHLLVIPVGLLILAFLVFGSYRLIQNVFKWLALALLAYIVSAFLARPDLGQVLAGTFIPHINLDPAFLALVVAGLGGNVSPYLFFWQADLEVADEHEHGIMRGLRGIGARKLKAQLTDIAWDTVIGMVFSNVIIFFIEVATAATLFNAGTHDINSAAQAAEALRPLLGNAATLLWAVGMIGAGILAVPALTGSAADAVAAALGWRHGLEQQPRRAWHFYAVLAAALVIATLIDFLPINPIQALVLSAALNGMLTPPLLVLLMLLVNRRDVMGEHTNTRWLNILGWGTIAIMGLAAVGLIVTSL